eukprot:ANDGO_01565.mRNA.1 hypothetical protein
MDADAAARLLLRDPHAPWASVREWLFDTSLAFPTHIFPEHTVRIGRSQFVKALVKKIVSDAEKVLACHRAAAEKLLSYPELSSSGALDEEARALEALRITDAAAAYADLASLIADAADPVPSRAPVPGSVCVSSLFIVGRLGALLSSRCKIIVCRDLGRVLGAEQLSAPNAFGFRIASVDRMLGMLCVLLSHLLVPLQASVVQNFMKSVSTCPMECPLIDAYLTQKAGSALRFTPPTHAEKRQQSMDLMKATRHDWGPTETSQFDNRVKCFEIVYTRILPFCSAVSINKEELRSAVDALNALLMPSNEYWFAKWIVARWSEGIWSEALADKAATRLDPLDKKSTQVGGSTTVLPGASVERSGHAFASADTRPSSSATQCRKKRLNLQDFHVMASSSSTTPAPIPVGPAAASPATSVWQPTNKMVRTLKLESRMVAPNIPAQSFPSSSAPSAAEAAASSTGGGASSSSTSSSARPLTVRSPLLNAVPVSSGSEFRNADRTSDRGIGQEDELLLDLFPSVSIVDKLMSGICARLVGNRPFFRQHLLASCSQFLRDGLHSLFALYASGGASHFWEDMQQLQTVCRVLVTLYSEPILQASEHTVGHDHPAWDVLCPSPFSLDAVFKSACETGAFLALIGGLLPMCKLALDHMHLWDHIPFLKDVASVVVSIHTCAVSEVRDVVAGQDPHEDLHTALLEEMCLLRMLLDEFTENLDLPVVEMLLSSRFTSSMGTRKPAHRGPSRRFMFLPPGKLTQLFPIIANMGETLSTSFSSPNRPIFRTSTSATSSPDGRSTPTKRLARIVPVSIRRNLETAFLNSDPQLGRLMNICVDILMDSLETRFRREDVMMFAQRHARDTPSDRREIVLRRLHQEFVKRLRALENLHFLFLNSQMVDSLKHAIQITIDHVSGGSFQHVVDSRLLPILESEVNRVLRSTTPLNSRSAGASEKINPVHRFERMRRDFAMLRELQQQKVWNDKIEQSFYGAFVDACSFFVELAAAFQLQDDCIKFLQFVVQSFRECLLDSAVSCLVSAFSFVKRLLGLLRPRGYLFVEEIFLVVQHFLRSLFESQLLSPAAFADLAASLDFPHEEPRSLRSLFSMPANPHTVTTTST